MWLAEPITLMSCESVYVFDCVLMPGGTLKRDLVQEDGRDLVREQPRVDVRDLERDVGVLRRGAGVDEVHVEAQAVARREDASGVRRIGHGRSRRAARREVVVELGAACRDSRTRFPISES